MPNFKVFYLFDTKDNKYNDLIDKIKNKNYILSFNEFKDIYCYIGDTKLEKNLFFLSTQYENYKGNDFHYDDILKKESPKKIFNEILSNKYYRDFSMTHGDVLYDIDNNFFYFYDKCVFRKMFFSTYTQKDVDEFLSKNYYEVELLKPTYSLEEIIDKDKKNSYLANFLKDNVFFSPIHSDITKKNDITFFELKHTIYSFINLEKEYILDIEDKKIRIQEKNGEKRIYLPDLGDVDFDHFLYAIHRKHIKIYFTSNTWSSIGFSVNASNKDDLKALYTCVNNLYEKSIEIENFDNFLHPYIGYLEVKEIISYIKKMILVNTSSHIPHYIKIIDSSYII